MSGKQFVSFDQYHVPIEVRREFRRSIRFALGKTRATVLMPKFLPSSEVAIQTEKAKSWIREKIRRLPHLGTPFVIRDYIGLSKIELNGVRYQLEIEEKNGVSPEVKLLGDTIKIRIGDNLALPDRSKTIRKLLSKVIVAKQMPKVRERVDFFNQKFINRPVNRLSVKLNYSNWGSCSMKGNINLSSRILLAPDPIMDYVIVHELCHLVELNHSDRFWKLVENILPDYRDRQRWLKKNGHLLDF